MDFTNHQGAITIDQLNQAGKSLFPELLAIEVDSWDGAAIICRMPVRRALLATNGYMHAAAE